jgi:hypothetical protein
MGNGSRASIIMNSNKPVAYHIFSIFVEKLRAKLTGFLKAPAHISLLPRRAAAYQQKPLRFADVPGKLFLIVIARFEAFMVNENIQIRRQGKKTLL